MPSTLGLAENAVSQIDKDPAFITRAFSEGGAGGVFFEGGIFLGAECDVTTMAVRRGKRPNL